MFQRPSFLPAVARLAAAAACVLSAGCLTDIATGTTVHVMRVASPAMGRFNDIQLAEDAIPAGISTMEGLLVARPDDADLHESLARAYASLAFGFVVDHMEEALALDTEEGDARAEEHRQRALRLFGRAKEVGLEQMTLWEDDDGGAAGAISRGIEAWTAYLTKFDDTDQAPMLLWTAYAWAQTIGLSHADMDALSDLPYATALIEHVLRLDPTTGNYAPHGLRAGLLGGIPRLLGGRPDEARREFEIAIRATHRHNFMYLVMEARIVAVALQDRTLYRERLEEVLRADPNVVLDWRLSNLIAQKRARRYLAQIDDFFPPDEGAGGGQAPAEGSGDGDETATPPAGEGAATTEPEAVAPTATAPAATPAAVAPTTRPVAARRRVAPAAGTAH